MRTFHPSFFLYIITFMNSQYKKTNLKTALNVRFKDFGFTQEDNFSLKCLLINSSYTKSMTYKKYRYLFVYNIHILCIFGYLISK